MNALTEAEQKLLMCAVKQLDGGAINARTLASHLYGMSEQDLPKAKVDSARNRWNGFLARLKKDDQSGDADDGGSPIKKSDGANATPAKSKGGRGGRKRKANEDNDLGNATPSKKGKGKAVKVKEEQRVDALAGGNDYDAEVDAEGDADDDI